MKAVKLLLSSLLLVALVPLSSCTDNQTPGGDQPSTAEDEMSMSENRAILERELVQTECKDNKMDYLIKCLEKMEIGTIVSVEVRDGQMEVLPEKKVYYVTILDDQGAEFTFGLTSQGNVNVIEKRVGDTVWTEITARLQ
jgi:hypothetical protein